MRKNLVLLAFLITASLNFAYGQKVVMNITLSPMGSFKIVGNSLKGAAFVQKDGSVAAKNVVLDLRDLKTDIELRDKHVQEYFETDKYPEAILHLAVGKNNKFKGDLQVHGVRKRIEGTYQKSETKLAADFKVKKSDFKIKEASYMGVGVEDEIHVQVDIPVENSKATASSSKKKSSGR